MQRYLRGENLTIAFVGGSITAGSGAWDDKSFPTWAETILHEQMGNKSLSVRNGAVPGTTSAYMSVCHNVHVPREADIVIVEYSVNDPEDNEPKKRMDNPHRRAFERLLRKLLTYPRCGGVPVCLLKTPSHQHRKVTVKLHWGALANSQLSEQSSTKASPPWFAATTLSQQLTTLCMHYTPLRDF